MNDDSMMIPKRETPQAVEERGTVKAKYAGLSSRAMRKGKVIEVLALVLIALILLIYAFYRAKLVLGRPIWGGFWAFTIFIGVWLIFGIASILRKR